MRVAIFFDGKNFYSGWMDRASNRQIDFVKLSEWLVGRVKGSQLWGAYYYVGIETGQDSQKDGQKRLVAFLKGLELLPGYFVKRFARTARSTRCRGCGATNRFTQEKEVDTTMVADMLRLAAVNAFDAMILISGDRDHLPAVEGVQSLGKKAYVASWGGRGLAGPIRTAVFDHIDMLAGLPSFETQPLVPTPNTPSRPGATVRANKPPNHSSDNADTIFIRELRLAESHFSSGYVGLNYFLRKWQSNDLDASESVRGRILDKLIKSKEVEAYSAPDGNTAIRTVAPVSITKP